MQRQLVFHLKVDIERAGLAAGTQRRRHLAVRQLVQRDDVLLDLRNVRHGAFGERRRQLLDVAWQVVLRIDDAQPLDTPLRHVQADDAVRGALLRDLDLDRLEAAALIGALERLAGLIDIGRRLAFAEKG